MTVVAMAQRRKVATYGKPSHKPILIAAGAFAHAVGTEIRDPVEQLQDWNEDAVLLRSYTTRSQANDNISKCLGRKPPSKPLQSKKDTKTTLTKPRSSSLVSRDISEHNTLYEPPSDDEDEEAKTGVSDALSHKRRKTVPNSAVNEATAVFDDASLQRHVAAEAGEEMKRTPMHLGKSAVGDHCQSAHATEESPEKKRLSLSIKQHEHLKGGKPYIQENATHRDMVSNIKAKSKATARPGAGNRAGISKAKTSPRKLHNTKDIPSKDIVRPRTPESLPRRHLVHRSGGSQAGSSLAATPFPQSNTPIRRTKTPDTVTTPRQRELWNRLLSDDAHIESPSNLDLPGLMLTDRDLSQPNAPPTARKVTSDGTQEPELKTRPTRLVDTLEPTFHSLTNSDGEIEGYSSEESSNDAHSRSIPSESSAINDALTVQTSPSADSQSRLELPHHDDTAQTLQAPTPLYGVGLKVTYARQRSYLTEFDLDEAAMLGMPIVPEPKKWEVPSRRSLGDRVPGSQSTTLYDDDNFGASQASRGGAMRSIHELREAGGNVRLVSELEAMLDDIEEHEPVSISLRRTRLIDLVTILQEPSKCRFFIDQGLESRLLGQFGFGDDPIVNSLLAAAFLQLIVGPTSAPLLAQLSDLRVVEFLVELLGLNKELTAVTKLRSTNMSKLVRMDYQKLCTSLLNSSVWRAGKPPLLSCHMLSLQCLEHLVRQTREAGSLSEVLSAHAIRRIVITSLPSSSTLSTSPSVMSTINLELAVSILESCTISNVAEGRESLWAGETIERVIGLLPLLASWKEEECGSSQTLTLRLYLNLTNNNPGLCEDFSTPNTVDALFRIIVLNFQKLSDHVMVQKKPLLLDHLILSLGFFINLAESTDVVRNLTMKFSHEEHSYLDSLLELFLTKSKSAAEVYSEEETSSNVAVGYLAVLLSFLCLNEAVKTRVSARLHGGTSEQLVDALEEFLQYHRQIDQEIYLGGGEDDARDGFVGRLQGLVDDLRA